MDFIERIFGISPDGGSGTFELLLLMLPVLGLFALWRARSRGRARQRREEKDRVLPAHSTGLHPLEQAAQKLRQAPPFWTRDAEKETR